MPLSCASQDAHKSLQEAALTRWLVPGAIPMQTPKAQFAQGFSIAVFLRAHFCWHCSPTLFISINTLDSGVVCLQDLIIIEHFHFTKWFPFVLTKKQESRKCICTCCMQGVITQGIQLRKNKD